MTLAVSISQSAEQRLAAKARAAGVDLPTFASRLLEAEANLPSLLEMSGEVYENFKRMNLTDGELAEKLEEEKHAVRAARRGKPFAE